ncbi:MAG: putative membrane-bound dehydrogenase-like protein, partial [Rhodothermales bacterium]
ELPRTYPDGHGQVFVGGRNDNFANFEGRLDEAAVYDRVLKPEEVSAHYHAAGLKLVKNEPQKAAAKPLAPNAALQSIQVPKGFKVELVAAEPLVIDPVAIDWGADGKLWVAEMADYPYGINGKPGGRIRFLEDKDGDGSYDAATVFLSGVNFPTGVMSWGKGVLVTAAPEIFYAEDTDGDGEADLRKTLFTGFKEGNQQLRVNGLRWGLDNWVHCAGGSHQGNYAAKVKILSTLTQTTIPLGGRDFRIDPDRGLLDPRSGPSQFGRERDDWGNWFGVQNSYPVWHYVLLDPYMRRHPDYAPPDARKLLTPRNPQVYPAHAPQKRFHSFSQSGRYTSACSPHIYRDDLLYPADGKRHVFTCEPFHNLVQHLVLGEAGVSFTARRADPESKTDFFASDDRWCRPVMTRTGPDGALWVVDMYRYMIEHPDWLPSKGKAELKANYRTGDGHGRIYRIVPEGKPSRQGLRLAAMKTGELVTALAHSNGPTRDTAQRLLVKHADPTAVEPLKKITADHELPLARLHALATLDGMRTLPAELLLRALKDTHAGVRRHALRLVETHAGALPDWEKAVAPMAEDPDPKVRMQLAFLLGESASPDASHALAKIAAADGRDPYFRAAVLSSSLPHHGALVKAALNNDALMKDLLKLSSNQRKSTATLVRSLSTPKNGRFTAAQFNAFARWLDSLDQRQTSMAKLSEGKTDALAEALKGVDKLFEAASKAAVDSAAAASLLGRRKATQKRDFEQLKSILASAAASPVKRAAVERIARSDTDVTARLLADWPGHLPEVRIAVVDTLLQRKEWSLAFLQQVQQGAVSRNELDTTRRQLFLSHTDPAVRELAQAALRQSTTPERLAQIAAFRPALTLPGDPRKGEQVFAQLCAVCHQPADGSVPIGPDLRSITDRSPEGLFSSIFSPNEAVDPGYIGFHITLNDQKNLYGRVSRETANGISLVQLDGSETDILRRDIKTMKSTGRSLMPDGLEAAMTQQSLADLLHFLRESKSLP